MLKRVLPLIAMIAIVQYNVACTSKEKEAKAEDAEIAEMAGDGVDAAAPDKGSEDEFGLDEEVSESGDDVVADLGADELSADEKLPEDGSASSDVAKNDDPFADQPNEGAVDSLVTPSEPSEDSQMAESSPTPEPMAPLGESETVDTGSDEGMEEKKSIPVKKIAEAPFKKNGVLVNAVYLARPGDTVSSVAQKIYGQDRSDEILKANPNFKGRGLKPGDKVYYNSPNRPTDDSKLLVFYEEIGLQPEIYIAKDGDDIRKVSKQLLGDEGSWKEVWATNAVESKGALASGTQLRYWVGGETVALANNEGSASNSPADMPPPPPPPPDNMAMNEQMPPPPPPDLPPPPPDMGNMADNGNPPPMPDDGELPPPPAMGSIEPPPPPPPPPPSSMNKGPKVAGGDDPNQTMALAAGAVLMLAAVALFIVRRKKARRQLDFNTSTQTQIE